MENTRKNQKLSYQIRFFPKRIDKELIEKANALTGLLTDSLPDELEINKEKIKEVIFSNFKESDEINKIIQIFHDRLTTYFFDSGLHWTKRSIGYPREILNDDFDVEIYIAVLPVCGFCGHVDFENDEDPQNLRFWVSFGLCSECYFSKYPESRKEMMAEITGQEIQEAPRIITPPHDIYLTEGS